MTNPIFNKVFLTLIKEVKDFLPELEELIFVLKEEDSDRYQITTEFHGIMSTIMGVSSMMNLEELTNTAALINKVLDDILNDKLDWNQRLVDVMTETVQQINKYCSTLEAKKNVDDTLYKNALSAFSEFEKDSVDDSDQIDSQEEDLEEDFFVDISFDEDSDDFFEDLDMDITNEEDITADAHSEITDSEVIDIEVADSEETEIEETETEVTDSWMTGIDPEFLESFNEESEDHINAIGQQLNILAPVINKKIGISNEYRNILHDIRRSVHTLKGAAAVIGIKTVASFGNEFEDFLDWLHDESDSLSPEIITVMLDGTDILERLSINPAIKINIEINEIKNVFQTIMADILPASIDEAIDQPEETEQTKAPEALDVTSEDSDDSGTADIDQEFLESFNEESRDHLNSIDQQLNLLSSFIKAKTDIFDGYRDILHSIRRSVHTLKGAAAVIGIKSVASFGNELEDFLDWLHDESDSLSPEIITAMLDGTDILERLSINPAIEIDNEINEIKNIFQTIMTDLLPTDIDESTDQPEKIEETKTSETLNLDREEASQTIELSDDIYIDTSKNEEDSDAFFEELDLDIFDKKDISSDMLSQTTDSETSDLEIADSGTADIDPEFLESFNEESNDHINNIGKELNLLSPFINDKTDISNEYRDILHSIRRSVHTLKGAAAVIGIKSVASFGDEFEDFLDWLHDESDSLSPEIITAMLDGTDILERLSINPAIEIDNEIDKIKRLFKAIITDTVKAVLEDVQIYSVDVDEDVDEEKIEPEKIKQPGIEQIKISKTLRVDMGKVDQMIGLIGDMTINLSSHEDSSQFLQTTLSEFDNTMKRLKGIALNLETGFELAEIPHLSSTIGPIQKEDQNSDEFDPLEMDRYSDLHIMIRSLHEAVEDLGSIMDQTLKAQNLWRSIMGRQRRVVTEIQNSMQLIKMTPFSTLSNRLYKTVRESARVTEKSVRLVIEGSTMEMDTRVWNVLGDPMMHLLRNSVDHGIETPEERKKLKKSEQATIRIRCIRRGSMLNIHFSDDGKGLDYEAIRKRASELYPEKDVSNMDKNDLTALIFKQGFTIKTEATTISGRGVGMDVVDHAVKQLNGNIEVIASPGKGIEFIIRLPIEVAQLPALLVNFGQQEFAVPLRDINRVFKISRKQSRKNDFKLDNTVLPLLRPVEIMGLQPMVQQTDENPFALSVDVGSENGILITDSIIGKRDVVFKNLGSHLHNQVPCIAGATIMGNGSLIPIISTEELFYRHSLSTKPAEDADLEIHVDAPQHFKVLIVDDSISIRKVLSNFISNQGWLPTVAKDGVDAMEMIRQDTFDLILLDIEMPRMNGFDVLQSLQLHLDYSNIPVLMLTSRSAKKYKTKATELGARGFVTKPFKDDELLSLIKGFIKPALSTKKLKTGN